MNAPPLHDALAPLAFLLGTWRGEGKGEYPTIEPFSYSEEVRFWHVGKPFLAYSQQTWNPETGAPMHAEMGYWRAVGGAGIEVVLAHPTGIVEVQEGELSGRSLTLRSTAVMRTATAKQVDALERTFAVEGDVLRYDVRMSAVGYPLTHHLSAALTRVRT